MNKKYAAAFNQWMDDYVNNPEQFDSVTHVALEHLKQKLAGREPTYGETSAATFEAYLARA